MQCDFSDAAIVIQEGNPISAQRSRFFRQQLRNKHSQLRMHLHKILCLSICFATSFIPPRFIYFLMSTLNGRNSNEELSMSHKLNILIYFFPFEVAETWAQCSRWKMQLISIAFRCTATVGAGFRFCIECTKLLLNSIFLFFFPPYPSHRCWQIQYKSHDQPKPPTSPPPPSI